MEHIENMHADLKLAKKNPGWFLNLLCKTGCKFTTVTILHIQEKKPRKKLWLFIMEASTHLHGGGHQVPGFLVSTILYKSVKSAAPLTAVPNDQARYRSSFFFYFLGAETVVENGWQMLLTSIQDVCKTFGQDCKKRKHLAYIIGIVSHLTSESRSFLTFL